MKFSGLSLGLLATVALAAPTPTTNEVDLAVKRASTTDTPIGYASENGGTTGGAGGTTTTVSYVCSKLWVSRTADIGQNICSIHSCCRRNRKEGCRCLGANYQGRFSSEGRKQHFYPRCLIQSHLHWLWSPDQERRERYCSQHCNCQGSRCQW